MFKSKLQKGCGGEGRGDGGREFTIPHEGGMGTSFILLNLEQALQIIYV